MLNPTSTDAVGAALLAAFRHNFQMYKSLADRALNFRQAWYVI